MRKISLLFLLVLQFYINEADAQKRAHNLTQTTDPIYVSSWIDRRASLGKMINHKDTTASLSSFNGKLVIIGFWFTSCVPCITALPKENVLQKQFGQDVQFLLATYEPKERIQQFLTSWEKQHNTLFTIPIIIADTLLRKAIHYRFSPHYVWILPDGQITAQSGVDFINANTIAELLDTIHKKKAL